jgi:nitroreductase
MAHATHAKPERPLSALDVIFTRRSVRAYEKKKLDQPTIRALLDAAVRAPTAMHTERAPEARVRSVVSASASSRSVGARL